MEETILKLKKKQKIFMVLLVIGIVLLGVSVFLFRPTKDATKDAENFYDSKSVGGNAYIDMIAVSESFAVYEGYEDLGLHYAIDADGVWYIVAMTEEQFKKYDAQHDYFWNEKASEEKVKVYGQVDDIDFEGKKFAIECFNEMYGEQLVTYSNYEEYFGPYFLNMNVSATSYKNFFWGVVVAFVGLVLVALSIYEIVTKKEQIKDVQKAINGQTYDENGVVGYNFELEYVEDHKKMLGLIVGIVGAIIGSLIPIAFGILFDSIVWYAIVFIPFGFGVGYGLVCKGSMNVFVGIISTVVSTVLGFASMYIIYAWQYYEGLNKSIGNISFPQALNNLWPAIKNLDKPGEIYFHLGVSTVVALIGGIATAVSAGKKNK